MSRYAIVTGGSSGLGLQVLRNLSKLGYICFNVDRNPCSEFPTYVGDLSKVSEVQAAAQWVLKHTNGKMDVVVNNLGVNKIIPFDGITEEDFDTIFGTNVKATLFMSQAFIDALKESKGTILNIVSNAAEVPFSSSCIYNSSKAAQKMVTLQLGHESWRRKWGITVFGISPNKLEGPQDVNNKRPDESGMSTYILDAVSKVNNWTHEQTQAYQLTSLPAGKETSVSALAEYIAFLLEKKERHEFFNKTVIPFGA